MKSESKKKRDRCEMGTCDHQRRHWMCTVQLKHMGLEAKVSDGDAEARLRDLWSLVEADPRVVYACGQLERGEGGRLHGQCYVEFNSSLRNAQVRSVLPSFATHMRMSRTKCRDYCRKASDDDSERVQALPEIGKWRAERGDAAGSLPGPKQRCLNYLVQDGMTPSEITKRDP